MVQRSTVAVALVAVVVLLAGCSAVLDDGNGTGNGSVTDGEAPSDPSEFDYADGYGPDGVTDPQAAVESHNSGLIGSGSYTGTYRSDVETDDQSVQLNVTSRVDFDAEQGYQRSEVVTQGSTSTVEVYRGSDMRYRRSQARNQSRTRSSELAFAAEDLTTVEPVRPLLTNVSGYDASIEERNGRTLVVYETSGGGDIDSFYGINESAEVSSFSGQFAVDSDGIVRSASYELTYQVENEQRALQVEYAVSDVGETTVERPGWVDDA